MSRKKPTLKTKLCSALCQMVRWDAHQCEFVRIIPYKLSKILTEDEILGMFDWHHAVIPEAEGGPLTHWNLEPVQCAEHDRITATETIPQIAKGKRLRKASAAHEERMGAKDSGQAKPASRWPGRKLQSRNTFERRA